MKYLKFASSLSAKFTRTNIHSLFNTNIIKRMASNYLINDPKYSFLKELGISERNHGVFAKHSEWRGEGEKIDSICPSNNRPIASVIQGNLNDYEHCIEESENAWKIWADVN